MPDEFSHILQLDDFSFTNLNLPIRVFDTIEKNSTNRHFYADMEPHVLQRWMQTFRRLNPKASSTAEQLFYFYRHIALEVGNLNWRIDEDDQAVYLIAKRAKLARHSIYEDLMLKSFLEALLMQDSIENKTQFEFHMPYELNQYQKYTCINNLAQYKIENLIVIAKKAKHEINQQLVPALSNSMVSIKDQIVAAANAISPQQLNVNNLAFMLGISPRTLQRKIKPHDLSLKTIIQQVKFQHAKHHLINNHGNIKRTACDCGFIDPSRLTKLFLSQCELTPSQYVEKQRASTTKNAKRAIPADVI
ncbi:helix-turn-helix domain-containing protein [Shewanella waksmanii]|uniref:helix-turn-helix domain-containing protein n=1 Tax=Shewanella waksmanii TaxID=213783 RepID=UPI003736540C